MIYSEQIKKACNILFAAHKDDVDKAGYPYVFHPFFLATQMPDEKSVCVALLHDLVEDHPEEWSFDRLEEEGFDSCVIEALKLMTHNKGMDYMDYVHALSENPIARRVKEADLRHNMDISRLDGKMPEKFNIYRQALDYLEKNTNQAYLSS